MASSGIYTLDKTALDIIKKALLLCKAYDPNQSLSDDDRTTTLDSLNMMMKHWDAQGYHLWTLNDAVLFLTEDTQRYSIGPTGDNCCNEEDFVYTQVSTAGVAAAESIVLDSTTGMTGAPNIFATSQAGDVNAWTATNATKSVTSGVLTITNSGASAGYVELTLSDLTVGNSYRITYGYEDGTANSAVFDVYSDSVSIATATQTVTGTYTLDFTADQTTAYFRFTNGTATAGHTSKLTACNYVDKSTGDYIGIELDDDTMQWMNIVSISGTTVYLSDGLNDAAAVDNYVYTYSEKIQRPMRIMIPRYQADMTQEEIPVQQISRKDYYIQTDKASNGIVSQVHYQPKLTNGEIRVWQTADDNLSILRFSYNKPLEIFEDNQNTPNFPAEWYLACAYNLAAIIAPEYKADANLMGILEAKAQQYLSDVMSFDNETESLYFQPDFS
jgi:hypothetical protein